MGDRSNRSLQKSANDLFESFDEGLKYAKSWEDYNLRLGRIQGARALWKIVCEEAALD